MSVNPVSAVPMALQRSNPDEYTVKSGDTLSEIAASHGMSLAALEKANPQIDNPNLIRVGQTIHIPDGNGHKMHTGPEHAVNDDAGGKNHTESVKTQSSGKGHSPSSMTISQDGVNLIEKYEGFRNDAYQDAVGVWTIGYGHTSMAGEPKVYPGMHITRAQGESILENDLVEYENAVRRNVHVPLTQGQFDALVSLTYNVGPGGYSTLLNDLNSGNYAKAQQDFHMYVHAGGRVLQGLVRRRNEEAAMFGGEAPVGTAPSPAPAPSPSGGGTYTVRSGDTMSGIAARFGVSLSALEAANPQISNPNLIHPGQTIHIPGKGSSAPSPPPAPAPAPSPSGGGTYTVRSGDTMSGIAARLGVSLSALEAANPQISNPNLIHPGQTIHIPGKGGSAPASHDYTVQRGDSMSSIASRNGVSLSALEAANPQISNPNLIHPGQTIHIPGKGGSAPASHDYTVQRGDSMSSIASRNGVSLSALEAANPQISNPNLIHPGQTIHIPGKSSSAPAPSKPASHDYTVQRGDSMSSIASRNGVSLSALERANPQISNPNLIHPGQTIHIPGKGSSAPAPSKPQTHNYTVRRGDTMSGIAARNGVSLSVLEKANPQISNPNRISVGQTIHIPGAGPVDSGGPTRGTNAASIAHSYYGMYASQLENQGVIIDGVDTKVCCANFVTAMLIQAGEVPAHGMNFVQRVNVSAMSDYLQAHGWSIVPRSQAKPGDVWVSSSEGHTELVYGNNNGSLKLIGSNNHPVWTNQQVNYSNHVTSGYVLAPPH